MCEVGCLNRGAAKKSEYANLAILHPCRRGRNLGQKVLLLANDLFDEHKTDHITPCARLEHHTIVTTTSRDEE